MNERGGGRRRVLGVDPGSRKTGWGVVDASLLERRIVHVDNGVIMLDEHADLPTRLLALSRRLTAIVDEYRPDLAAVEDVFVQKGARSALILGQARGAALAVLGMKGLAVATHSTSEVKLRVTGRGRATKDQVAGMVSALLGLQDHPFEDAADALAVAICQGATTTTGVPLPPKAPRRRDPGGRDSLRMLARAQGKVV